MPIVMGYEPVGAVGTMAYGAGQGQYNRWLAEYLARQEEAEAARQAQRTSQLTDIGARERMLGLDAGYRRQATGEQYDFQRQMADLENVYRQSTLAAQQGFAGAATRFEAEQAARRQDVSLGAAERSQQLGIEATRGLAQEQIAARERESAGEMDFRGRLAAYNAVQEADRQVKALGAARESQATDIESRFGLAEFGAEQDWARQQASLEAARESQQTEIGARYGLAEQAAGFGLERMGYEQGFTKLQTEAEQDYRIRLELLGLKAARSNMEYQAAEVALNQAAAQSAAARNTDKNIEAEYALANAREKATIARLRKEQDFSKAFRAHTERRSDSDFARAKVMEANLGDYAPENIPEVMKAKRAVMSASNNLEMDAEQKASVYTQSYDMLSEVPTKEQLTPDDRLDLETTKPDPETGTRYTQLKGGDWVPRPDPVWIAREKEQAAAKLKQEEASRKEAEKEATRLESRRARVAERAHKLLLEEEENPEALKDDDAPLKRRVFKNATDAVRAAEEIEDTIDAMEDKRQATVSDTLTIEEARERVRQKGFKQFWYRGKFYRSE